MDAEGTDQSVPTINRGGRYDLTDGDRSSK